MPTTTLQELTLQELAESYERWAAEAEALADQIMAGLNTQRKDVWLKQHESAQTFLEEAERLRREAAQLRETWCLPNPHPHLEKDHSASYSEGAS